MKLSEKSTEAKVPKHLEKITTVLDDLIVIPGTKIRVGLDCFLGMIPCLGDFLTACFSVYLLYLSALLGAPVSTLLKMSFNILVDAGVGCVPILGDVFDFGWKANRKNLNLLKALDSSKLTPRNHGQLKVFIKLAAVSLLICSLLLVYFIVKLIFVVLGELSF